MKKSTAPLQKVYPPIITDATIDSDDKNVTRLTTVNAYGKSWTGIHKRSRTELHHMISYNIVHNT